MFRTFPHKKDEALAMDIPFVRSFPIPLPSAGAGEAVAQHVAALEASARSRRQAVAAMRDWLRVTWELPSPPAALQSPFNLTADQFAQSLRAALPARRRILSAAAVAVIRAEHAATVVPMAAKLAEAARHEAALSAAVNHAYGLTREEEALVWATAPPRMPIPQPHTPVPTPLT